MATVRLASHPTSTALERLVDDYLTHCAARGLAPRTLTNSYGYALKAVFLPWCESEGIAELAQLDLRAVDRFTASLLQRRRADGRLISKYSVHTYVQPVRQMLNWAAAVGEEVKAKPQLPTRSKPLRDVLTREELDLLERAAVTERDKLIIRVFGDCGLRLEELTRLTASDIVRSGHQAFLRVLGKRSRVRDVPVTPLLLRRLERHIAARPKERSSDHIFLSLRRSRSGTCDPLTPNGVYQVIADAVTRAGLTKRVHPHLLRHSWMTEMLRQGMSPIQLSLIAGSSVQVISDHYTHLTKDDAYEAMIRALSAGRVDRGRRQDGR